MSDEAKKEAVSRRGFIGMGSAALAAAGMLTAAADADTAVSDKWLVHGFAPKGLLSQSRTESARQPLHGTME